jgi:hypothetical protein
MTGAVENTFDQCTFGLDTIQRSAANACLGMATSSGKNVFDKNVTDRELIDIFQDTMIVFIQENCKEMSQLSKTIRGLIKEQYPNLLDLGGDFRYYISGRYVSIMKVKRYKNVK